MALNLLILYNFLSDKIIITMNAAETRMVMVGVQTYAVCLHLMARQG